MTDENTSQALRDVILACGRLEAWTEKLHQQAHESQSAMRAVREQEEARFRQQLVAMHAQQQRLVEAALRPKLARAWQLVAALAGTGMLLFTGFLLLISRAEGRLKVAEARASAAEMRVDVQEAMRHLDITSCGGRPCIRLDRRTPKWKSANADYVFADGGAVKPR